MKKFDFHIWNSENLILFIHPHETTTQFKITSLVCVRIELTTLVLLAPRSTYWANRPTISNVSIKRYCCNPSTENFLLFRINFTQSQIQNEFELVSINLCVDFSFLQESHCMCNSINSMFAIWYNSNYGSSTIT